MGDSAARAPAFSRPYQLLFAEKMTREPGTIESSSSGKVVRYLSSSATMTSNGSFRSSAATASRTGALIVPRALFRRVVVGDYDDSDYWLGHESLPLCETPHELVEKIESVVERASAQLLVTPMRVAFPRKREYSANSVGRDAASAQEAAVGRPSGHRRNKENPPTWHASMQSSLRATPVRRAELLRGKLPLCYFL